MCKNIKIAKTSDEFYSLEKSSKIGDKIIWLNLYYYHQDIHVLKKSLSHKRNKFYNQETADGNYEED